MGLRKPDLEKKHALKLYAELISNWIQKHEIWCYDHERFGFYGGKDYVEFSIFPKGYDIAIAVGQIDIDGNLRAENPNRQIIEFNLADPNYQTKLDKWINTWNSPISSKHYSQI